VYLAPPLLKFFNGVGVQKTRIIAPTKTVGILNSFMMCIGLDRIPHSLIN